MRSKKWVQVTARRPTGERGEGPALLCFALPPLLSSLLLLSPICENAFPGRVEMLSPPPLPSLSAAVASVLTRLCPSLCPSGETQFTPLKSIVLRGTLQRGKKAARRERKRGDEGKNRKQPVSASGPNLKTAERGRRTNQYPSISSGIFESMEKAQRRHDGMAGNVPLLFFDAILPSMRIL